MGHELISVVFMPSAHVVSRGHHLRTFRISERVTCH
jgi:hypothetical protein